MPESFGPFGGGGGSGGAPSGAAGGDLTGTYPNPTLKATGPGATGPIGTATVIPVLTIDAQGRVTALTSISVAVPAGAALTANNLSDLANAATARTNLGLGTAATTASSAYDAAGAATTAQANAIALSNQRASNLSDVASATTARTNLGLGGAAILNVGAVISTVAAGDDARFTNSRAPNGAATGDLTGTYPAPTLATAGPGATGPIGSATVAPIVTIDAKGRVTGLTSATITQPTALPPNGAATGDLTGTYPAPTLAAIVGAQGPTGSGTVVPVVTIDAKGRVTAMTTAAITEPKANLLSLAARLLVLGHSYVAADGVGGGGTPDQRIDTIFQRMCSIPGQNYRNYAKGGSQFGKAEDQGSWLSVARLQQPQFAGAPYVGRGGIALIVSMLNDFNSGNTLAVRTNTTNSLQAAVARLNCSNFTPSDGFFAPTYGAGFVTSSQTTFNSSGGTRKATTTTAATVTIALPADYTGQPVDIFWVTVPSGTGGTVTYSGTAGVTGTTVTDVAPASEHGYIVKRITGLTSANASQTIICTVTAVAGTVHFDGWGLEADTPPLILVTNVARLLAAGYTAYGGTFADADIATLNTLITTSLSVFGSNVQIVDMDTALAKTAANFASDGIHPNEKGAYLVAKACYDKVVAVAPALNNAGEAPMPAPMRRSIKPGQLYTGPWTGQGATTAANGVMTAIPFPITEYCKLDMLGVDVTAGVAATTVQLLIYDDDMAGGFPGQLYANCGSLSTAVTGFQNLTPATWMVPQMYWLVLLSTATGATLRTLTGQNDWMPSASAATTQNAGWRATGVATTAPFPFTFPTSAVVDTAPFKVLLRTTTTNLA